MFRQRMYVYFQVTKVSRYNFGSFWTSDVNVVLLLYSGCNDIIINKEAAIISSPGYRLGPSFTYPPNLQCSWQINSPTDRELAIVFDDNFDTEVDFDVLTVSHFSDYTLYVCLWGIYVCGSPLPTNLHLHEFVTKIWIEMIFVMNQTTCSYTQFEIVVIHEQWHPPPSKIKLNWFTVIIVI